MFPPFARTACSAVLILLTLAPAQAAQWSVGAQAGTRWGPDALAAGNVGAHLSVQGAAGPSGLGLRGTLEGNLGLGSAPTVRLDLTLLKTSGRLYYGGGLGSGVALDFRDYGSGLPHALFTPLLLANVHGVLGRDLGGVRLEGVARLGLNPGLEMRASVPLR